MDQFASALSEEGHALHLWCDTVDIEQVPFRQAILVFDTRVSRSLRSSEFNTRKAECAEALELLRRSNPALRNLADASLDEVMAGGLSEPLQRRARHVVTELARIRAAVTQLRGGGTIAPELLYESHVSLRDDYQCSSPELDWFVEAASAMQGVEGARLTGAGWGGCAIAFGERSELEEAAASLAPGYALRFGHRPRTWISTASAGARIEAA